MALHRLRRWLYLFGSLVLLAANSSQAEAFKVLTSIRPLALLAADVGGTAVQVEVLLPGNSDPHDFALRISDLQRLQAADLVIWLGPEFERFLAKPMATRTASQQLALGTLPGLHWPPQSALEAQPSAAEHTGRDLHLWLDPSNAAVLARAISAQLQHALPSQQAMLSERLNQVLARLAASDADIQTTLSPLKTRGFGVYHNGYGHWVHHFGLQQTLSLSAMPAQHLSAKQLANARERLAGAACIITDVNEGNRQALARLFALPVLEADPLAQTGDYADFPAFLSALKAVFLACLQAAP